MAERIVVGTFVGRRGAARRYCSLRLRGSRSNLWALRHFPLKSASLAAKLAWIGAALLVLAGAGLGPVSEAAPVAAQSDTAAVAVDSSRMAVRRPPDSLLARFQADPAFDYRAAQGWTWWTDLRRWIWAQWSSLLGDNEQVGWILRIGFYVALALLIGYAAYMLVRLRSQARAPLRSSPSAVAGPQSSEEMRAIDFQERLETALAEEDYRRAVRLLYLQTLQRLDRAGTLTWRPSTTNRRYVEQLEADARSAFADLTRLFERIWYGTASVDAERFERVRARFEAFWEHQELPGPDSSSDVDAMRPVPSS